MIRAIIFDCFGVLTTDAWKAFVATLPAGQQVDASQLNRAFDSGHLSEAKFLEAIKLVTGRRPALLENQNRADVIKNFELLELIATLKSQYKIGLLSNIASDWITKTLLTRAEQALFDSLVFSYQVHLIKPDPRIYLLMADKLGTTPEACLMIDDNPANCRGAEAVGMQALHYENFEQARQAISQLQPKG